MRISIAAAFLLLVNAGSTYAAEFETPLAFVNGNVVTAPGNVVENGTVVVENGRIAAVGKSVKVPDDARVVDISGRWVYPGFIDAASHAGVEKRAPSEAELDRITDIEKDQEAGPRTGMQKANRQGLWPHRSVRDLYKTDEKKLEAYRKAGFTTALIAPHPAILSGTADVVQLSGAPLRTAIVKSAVAQVGGYDPPFDFSNIGSRGYPYSRMGVMALLRQTFLDAQWYKDSRAREAKAPTKVSRVPDDPVLEAVGDLVDGERFLLFAADSANEIYHALDAAEEFDQKFVIFGGREAWKFAHRIAEKDAAVVARLDWDEKPKRAPKNKDDAENDHSARSTKSWTPEWEDDFFEPLALRDYRIREWEERVQNAQRLLEAGVAVAFTSAELKGPGDFAKRIRDMIELGLTEDQALACLTTTPAKLFDLERQIGSIQEGALANLAVFTKPFTEKDTKTPYVVVDGQLFEHDTVTKKEDEEKEEDAESGEQEESKEEESDESEEEEKEKEEPVDNHPWTIESDDDRKPKWTTGGDILLTNATVVTVTNGDLEDTDILIRDGKIAQIGKDLSTRRNVTTVDLDGYWVMPGIIDPHSHLAIRGVNESSQSITAEVRMADVVDHEDAGIYRALAGGVTTIHSMHGSANTIGGQNVVFKLKYKTSPGEMIVDSGPRLVKFALGENVTRANSRSRRNRFPASRMGVESVLRQAFTDARAYAAEWEQYKKASRSGRVIDIPRRDIRLEALNEILDGDIWVHCHSYRADEILRLITVTSENGIRVACMQHVLEGYRVMPEMHRLGVGGSTFSDNWAYKMEAYNAIPQNAAMMLKYGIVSSLNSDSPEVIRHMNLEAAKSMRFGGLTADEALSLITINPAIQLGLDDRIGSIEKGKDGDVAVFTSHPLDTFSKCVMTLIEGEPFFVDRDFDHENPRPNSGNGAPEPPREPLPLPVSENGVYAIVRGDVYPVSHEPIPRGTVIIRDGKVEQVGKDVEIPNDATIVDATGLEVYPGLINAATQLGLIEIGSITGTRDTGDIAEFQPDIHALTAVHAHSAHVEIARAEGLTTAMPLPSGGVISGRAGAIQLDGWSMPEMLREWETGLVMNLPSLPGDMDDENRKERIDGKRESMERIEAYIEKAKHYAKVRENSDAAEHNVQLDAMIPYVTGEKPILFTANSYKEILEALKFAKTFELKAIILGGRDAWKCTEQLREHKVPVIVTSVMDLPRERYELHDGPYSNAAKLYEADVPFCIAETSGPNAKLLPINAGQAAAYGLHPNIALRSITLSPAEILGLDDRIGSLEPGKQADVVVTTGHPCQASTRTVLSFIGGKPVDLSSMHERHYQTFKNRPEPDMPPAPKDLNGPPPLLPSKD